MAYGPIELVVVHFEGNNFRGEIIPAIERLVNNGIVRIVDIAFLTKDENGDVIALEVGDLPSDESSILGALVAEQGGLISDEDFADFGANLEPNSSAGLILFENVWATEFVTAIRNANGQVVLNERIPRAVIDELIRTQEA